MAGVPQAERRYALTAICVFVAALGLWNVAHYPPAQGYDAAAHIAYATGLVPGGHLPGDTGVSEYYTPPGFYAIAGSAVWLAEQIGLNSTTSLRVAMALNVGFLLGTVLLVASMSAQLWPGRARVQLGATAFVALLPVVVEAEAMFHPETLSLFLSTLALWLCLRTLADPRLAAACGVALGLAQLVRAFALWTVAAVLLTLLVARRWRSLVVVLVLAALIPSPWYVHQALTYGGQPTFPQPITKLGRGAHGAVKPLYDRRPLRFYLDVGLPDVLAAPYRPHVRNLALPTTYAGVWGDYFGVWVWTARPLGPYGTHVVVPPPRSARRRLVLQSLVGLLPTLLAVVGWLLVALASRRRPDRLLLALLPGLGLLGFLYFTVSYPTPDGDVIKASYMLTTAPGWAIGFGYALDRLRGRAWRATVVLLALCALGDLTFLVYS